MKLSLQGIGWWEPRSGLRGTSAQRELLLRSQAGTTSSSSPVSCWGGCAAVRHTQLLQHLILSCTVGMHLPPQSQLRSRVQYPYGFRWKFKLWFSGKSWWSPTACTVCPGVLQMQMICFKKGFIFAREGCSLKSVCFPQPVLKIIRRSAPKSVWRQVIRWCEKCDIANL